MIVEGGIEWKEMRVSDFSMVSVSRDRVVLPYTGELWGDFLVEAVQVILLQEDSTQDDLDFDQLIESIETRMSFNIQKRGVRVTAHIRANLKSGRHIDGCVFIRTKMGEVRPVLDCFFGHGGKGLDLSYATYYMDTYKDLASR